MRIFFVLTPLLVFFATTYQSSGIQPATINVAAAQKVVTKTKLYGSSLGPGKVIPLKDVLKNPELFADKTVVVTGQVRQACTKKGCWIELSNSWGSKAQGCRVTFKDYGFFVPLDSAGASAKIQGTVGIKKLSKAAVDHYEAEGAIFSRKETDGSAYEIRIVATGVELTKN